MVSTSTPEATCSANWIEPVRASVPAPGVSPGLLDSSFGVEGSSLEHATATKRPAATEWIKTLFRGITFQDSPARRLHPAAGVRSARGVKRVRCGFIYKLRASALAQELRSEADRFLDSVGP